MPRYYDSDSSESSDSSTDSVDSDDVYAGETKEESLRKLRMDVDNDKTGSPELRAIVHILLKNAENGGILRGAKMEYDTDSFDIHTIVDRWDQEFLSVTYKKKKYRCFLYKYPYDLHGEYDHEDIDPVEEKFKSTMIDKAVNWLLEKYNKCKQLGLITHPAQAARPT
jgi:hypothetical protein